MAWLEYFFFTLTSSLKTFLGVELTAKGNQFKVSDNSNGLLYIVDRWKRC